jgi:antitoxin component of RelBE/YafQ-DinJ toxin-antitoxin module
MTLLQTRVDDRVASRFKQAARKRDMSPYQLLNELVKQTAAETHHGWDEHWARMKTRNQTRLKQNAVVATREDEDR